MCVTPFGSTCARLFDSHVACPLQDEPGEEEMGSKMDISVSEMAAEEPRPEDEVGPTFFLHPYMSQ